MSKKSNKTRNEKAVIALIVIAVVTAILWQFQAGRYILYPFTILGTWFHEMGHGLSAMILGGSFKKLEIYANGSGLAIHSGTLLLGNIGNAIVAAAGPIGPSIAGAAFMLSSGKAKSTKFMLYFLGILLIISALIWVRPLFGFGFIFILIFGTAIFFIARKADFGLQRFTLRFLGVQACLSVYLSIDYLFSPGANVSGYQYLSDTSVIQQNLFLPYWMWGALILAFSALVIVQSLIFIYKGK